LCRTLNFSVAFGRRHWFETIYMVDEYIYIYLSISTIVKLCIKIFCFGFILCRDIGAVM
jgi:hypothetical protein